MTTSEIVEISWSSMAYILHHQDPGIKKIRLERHYKRKYSAVFNKTYLN